MLYLVLRKCCLEQQTVHEPTEVVQLATLDRRHAEVVARNWSSHLARVCEATPDVVARLPRPSKEYVASVALRLWPEVA